MPESDVMLGFPPARAVAFRAGEDVKKGKASAFHRLRKLGEEKR
jgi:hypothetical protein